MFGFQGFERDFVDLVARHHVQRDVRALASMRRVSRAWRDGCQRQWAAVKAECTLSPSGVTVFERDESNALRDAVLYAFKHSTNIAISIANCVLEEYTGVLSSSSSSLQFEKVVVDTDVSSNQFDFKTDDAFCIFMRVHFRSDVYAVNVVLRFDGDLAPFFQSTWSLINFVALHKMRFVTNNSTGVENKYKHQRLF